MPYATDTGEDEFSQPEPPRPYAGDFVSISDPTTYGSEQYNRELAKANEPISDKAYPGVGGDANLEDVARLVHLHLSAAAAQAKAKEQAIRFKGQQEFQQLVDGGATPQEALRRTAKDIYYNNPEAMVRQMQLAEAQKRLPLETQTSNGQTFYRTGPNSFAHIPQPNPNSRNAMPLDQQQELKTANENVVRKNRDLNTAQADLREAMKATNLEDRREAQEAVTKARQAVDAAEGNRLYISTNWQSRAAASSPMSLPGNIQARAQSAGVPMNSPAQAAPAAAEAPKAEEVVRYTKDGRKAIFDAKTKAFIRFEDEGLRPEER